MTIVPYFGYVRHIWMRDPTPLTFDNWLRLIGARVEEKEQVLSVVFDNDEDATAFRLKYGI